MEEYYTIKIYVDIKCKIYYTTDSIVRIEVCVISIVVNWDNIEVMFILSLQS